MNTYIVKLSDLINDHTLMNQIIDLLKIKNLGAADQSLIRYHLNQFLLELRDELSIVIETEYVDSVYRDSYYDFFSTKHYPYRRNCVRFSFFDENFKTGNHNKEDYIKAHYLGFLILRPILKCIGRNVINPIAKKNFSTDLKICKANVESTCMGFKLHAEGFPHASQDNETMTCAQTTIWTIMEYYGNKYTCYRPVLPSDIIRVLEPFSYERQMPSEGLTYNQISVALRKFGFGSKISHVSPNSFEESKELIACYIESGIPLAIAMSNNNLGHAVVCLGLERPDKTEVTNYSKQLGKKSIYSWNKTAGNANFIFNDDNWPCYQLAPLNNPAINYGDPAWQNTKINGYIVPLYVKVYMEAKYAINLSERIVETVLQNIGNEMVMKTFLTSCRSYREYIAKNASLSPDMKMAILSIDMPKFVWITELSTVDQFQNDKINTMLIIDATGNKTARWDIDVIFMLSEGLIYKYEPSLKQIAAFNSSFPKEIEAFQGNLK